MPEAAASSFKQGLLYFIASTAAAFREEFAPGHLRFAVRMPNTEGIPGLPVPSRPKVLPALSNVTPSVRRSIDDRMWRCFQDFELWFPAFAGKALIEAEAAPNGAFFWTDGHAVFSHLPSVTGHEVLEAVEGFLDRREAEA